MEVCKQQEQTPDGGWLYNVIYYTKDFYKDKMQDMEQAISTRLVQLFKNEQLEMVAMNIEADKTYFLIRTSAQVHIQKILKSIIKKLYKVIGQQEIWESEYVLITTKVSIDEKDLRLQRVIDSLSRVGHYDIEQSFRDIPEAFKDYLSTRALATLDIGNELYIIDKEALTHKVNLNCKECTKIFKYGCCSGSPCDYSPKNKRNFDKHKEAIARQLRRFNSEDYAAIEMEGELVSEVGRVREHKGYCSLLVKDEEWYKCIAHSYAIEQNISIYELCPLSCLMYPLEVIELVTDKEKSIRLITSVVDKDFAKNYGRWGDYECLDVDMRCLDEHHPHAFQISEYKPIYLVNKELLIHEFGMKLYDGIVTAVE